MTEDNKLREPLQQMRRRLLDVSNRNRLLNFRESKVRTIRIVDELPDQVFSSIVSNGRSMDLLSVAEPDLLDFANSSIITTHELPTVDGQIAERHSDNHLQTPYTPQKLERLCNRLAREARTAIEETGCNMLFLAIGFLEWYEDDSSDTSHLAPLILLPVQIEKIRLNRDTNCYSYVISFSEEDIETNLSLAEKLLQDFDLILPDLSGENSPDAYFDGITSKIIRHKQRWHIRREMVLDLFSFAKIQMYKDLDDAVWPDGAKLIANRNLAEILTGREEQDGMEVFHQQEYDIDREPLAQNLHLVLDADSSQQSAVIDALHRDNNLVIEGPPGTGKSQTITNIIASALGMGKSVLFVAEKKAALEVVRTRLEKVGLGDFCLELHSHKTQKGKLHADLRTRLNKTFDAAKNLYLELADLKASRDTLLAYSQLVNSEVGLNGERIFQVFWAVERWRSELPPSRPHIQVDAPCSLTRQQANERAILLQDISRMQGELPQEVISAWQGFSPTSCLPGDQEQVCALLTDLATQTTACLKEVKTLLTQGIFDAEPSLRNIRYLAQANLELFEQPPTSFDSQLAARLIDQKAADLVRQFHQTLQEYRTLLSQAQNILGTTDIPTDVASSLQRTIDTLEGAGYGECVVSELATLAPHLDNLPKALRNISSVTAEIPLILESAASTIDDAARTLNIIRVIAKAPPELAICCYPLHAHEVAPATLQKAQEECAALIMEKEALELIFSFTLMPLPNELIVLAREVRCLPHPVLALFSPSSWQLKRKIRAFLNPGIKQPLEELGVKLEQAAIVLQRIEEIAGKHEYSQLLGPLYRGITTEWEHLSGLVNWAQDFSGVVGSASRAMTLLQNMTELADIGSRFATPLQEAIERVKLLSQKANFTVDSTVEVGSLVEQLDQVNAAVASLLQPIGAGKIHGEKSIFDLKIGSEAYLAARSLSIAVESDRVMAELLGKHFVGTDTDSAYLVSLVDWLCQMLDEGHCGVDLLRLLVIDETFVRLKTMGGFIRSCRLLTQSFDKFQLAIGRYGEMDFSVFFCSDEKDCTLSAIFVAIETAAKQIDYLSKWADYNRLLQCAEDQGLKEFVTFLKKRTCTPDQVYALYQFAVNESLAREVMKNHPPLAAFSRSSIEGIIQRFIALDKKIQATFSKRIASKLSEMKVPPGYSGSRVSSLTDFCLIAHEIAKQKRHIPIRQLVRRAGNALQALKPCFMMSPLSVAQFIAPASLDFDLIVMDEASQLKPEDSLGAIVRGKKLVVVGDPRQLPPTSFFERMDGNNNDEDANLAEEAESILDRCLQIYPRRRLRWHYRSEHESLIAFSNSNFYDDNPLLLFPSPHRSNRRYGVHYHYVEGGQFQKGLNLVEAQTVVNAVKEHFRQCPGQSLGVATFNREQSDLIQELLEKLQKENALFDQQLSASLASGDPFFVKNLENVQGDERDVIFISTTYGPDPATGRVYQRFGPLAGETGWRRLNVIITRAKRRIEVFSSMHPSDITPTEGTKRGVHALKAYLEFASTGVIPDYGTLTGHEPDSDFEVAVMKVLQDFGYSAVPQVGVAGFAIDIGVKHPERASDFILGVECDGATYHSAKSVRDRDRLRQEILQSKGWRIHRIWSTDWFKNRETEIKRLLKAIDDAKNHDSVIGLGKEFAWGASLTQATLQSQPKTQLSTTAITSAEGTQHTATSLREELKVFYESQILPSFPDRNKGILRDEMLVHLVNKKPTSLDEFYKAVPMDLRQKTDGKQLQYLDEIFDLIMEYV